MTTYTIIFPLAGRSRRFSGTRPKWMLVSPDGELMLHKALRSVARFGNGRTVCGILAEHDQQYSAREGLQRAFTKTPLEVVVLPQDTQGPADTVAQIIRAADISGPILVKDCDSWYSISDAPPPNSVAIARLSEHPTIKNVASKSFVQLNKQMLVTAIIEKAVCSDYISVGGYCFEEANAFLELFARAQRSAGREEVFVSHVILQALGEGCVFEGVPVHDYVDVGTIQEWNMFRERQGTFVVDIDGVIIKNSGEFFGRLWDDPDELLLNNVRTLKMLVDNGGQLILVSARPERYRHKMEEELRAAGLTWTAFIMNCYHSRRYLINDYAPSNPYPSAVAINIRRDADELADYMPNAASVLSPPTKSETEDK